jgi:hypothetical protein
MRHQSIGKIFWKWTLDHFSLHLLIGPLSAETLDFCSFCYKRGFPLEERSVIPWHHALRLKRLICIGDFDFCSQTPIDLTLQHDRV